MDGQADDFLIDEDGDLVPVEDDWDPPAFVPGKVVAVMMIVQDISGESSVQICGTPDRILLDGIYTMFRGMALALKSH